MAIIIEQNNEEGSGLQAAVGSQSQSYISIFSPVNTKLVVTPSFDIGIETSRTDRYLNSFSVAKSAHTYTGEL